MSGGPKNRSLNLLAMSAEDEWLVSEEEEGNVRMESRDRVKMELQQHSVRAQWQLMTDGVS